MPSLPSRVLRNRDVNVAQVSEAADASLEKPTSQGKGRRKEKGPVKKQDALPQVSDFEPLQHKYPAHKAYNTLPQALQNLEFIEPSQIFALFFTDQLYEDVSEFSNHNAEINKAESTGRGKKFWKPFTGQRVRTFIGISIYMRIVSLPSYHMYWNTRGGLLPAHPITEYMSQTEFEETHRWISFNDPRKRSADPTVREKNWHQPVDYVLNQLHSACEAYRVPSSHVAVDEAIIRCTGRTKDTYNLRHTSKPIHEGYKFHCLADTDGYLVDFLPTSNNVGPDEVEPVPGLPPTSAIVYHLTRSLRNRKKQFNVYTDNYYTSRKLLAKLREEGIGGAGTLTNKYGDFPEELRADPKGMEYHFMAASADADTGVGFQFWMDNAPVTIGTTIHTLATNSDGQKNSESAQSLIAEGEKEPEFKSTVTRQRKRPGKKSTNAAGVKRSGKFKEGEFIKSL